MKSSNKINVIKSNQIKSFVFVKKIKSFLSVNEIIKPNKFNKIKSFVFVKKIKSFLSVNEIIKQNKCNQIKSNQIR